MFYKTAFRGVSTTARVTSTPRTPRAPHSTTAQGALRPLPDGGVRVRLALPVRRHLGDEVQYARLARRGDMGNLVQLLERCFLLEYAFFSLVLAMHVALRLWCLPSLAGRMRKEGDALSGCRCIARLCARCVSQRPLRAAPPMHSVPVPPRPPSGPPAAGGPPSGGRRRCRRC